MKFAMNSKDTNKFQGIHIMTKDTFLQKKMGIFILLTAGVTVKTVQGWAGHSDSHTTLDVYAQIDPSTFASASHALIYYIFDVPEVAELNS